MRAAWFETYGPAVDVLNVGTRDDPQPGHGEVLVRVHASGVNPSDVKKRAGLQPALDDGWVIPHSDGAGVIEAVGRGVPTARIGERVWLYQAQYQRRFGTAASHVALPSHRAIRLPAQVDFAVGACMGIPAMTAHRCVLADGSVTGQTLIITGAGGRVGYYAVQWAKWAGARVIATASNETSAEDAGLAGADVVLDYRSETLSDQVRELTSGRGVDRIVDVEFGANLGTSIEVLRTGGTIATYSSTQAPEPKLPFYPMMFKDISLRFVLVYAMPETAKRQAAADITRFLEDSKFTHRIAETFTLDDIAQAHEAVEQGRRGCVIVDTA